MEYLKNFEQNGTMSQSSILQGKDRQPVTWTVFLQQICLLHALESVNGNHDKMTTI